MMMKLINLYSPISFAEGEEEPVVEKTVAEKAAVMFPDADKKEEEKPAEEMEEKPEEKAEADDKDKAEDDKSDDKADDEEKKEDDKADAVIEMDAFKLREGFEVNDAMSTKFLEVMNDKDLSRVEMGQKLIEIQADAMEEMSQAINQSYIDTRTEWREGIEKHPEFGGDKLEANNAEVSKVVDKYGSDDFREMLALTGSGDHLEMYQFLMNVAKDMNEGTLISGGPNSQAPTTQAERLYPNQGKENT